MSQVQLAVYDLTRGLARSMSGAILGQQIDGIWHTGIVVYGYEYYFGGGIQKSPWGSFAQSNQLPPVQVLDMGTTTKTVRELETYLASIQGQFSMMTYDLIRNNCNNFADTVCNFLVAHGIPNHIVDLPRIVFSTPGGAMLRPMIENMQANIRQQNGQGLDPFAGASAQLGQRFEQQLSESVTSLVMNTMQQNSVLVKAELDEKPLLSKDFGTLAAMEKMLHNLAGPSGEKGSALTEEEHAILTAVVQRLLNESAAKTPDETEGFSINDYLLFEKLIATIPKAQSPALFVLRLMFLHDRTSDFSDLTIVRELKIVSKLEDIWSEGDESDASSSKKARPHKHSLKVALPGQSYNPSFEDHQDTLAQAVSIHMKKIEDAKTAFDLIAEQEAEAQKNQQSLTLAGDSSDDEDDEDEDGSDGATKKKKTGPKYNVSGEKMQAMTAVIMDEDQSSGSDDSDDESNASDDEDAKNKKRRQKVLTKAQRNKRRARRQAEHEAKLVAMEKKKLCDIIVVKHIKKNLAKEEAERLAQKKVREALEVERKRAEEEEKTKRLRSYEVSAVPLTDELQGSLRAIKPKGAPALDTMQSMIASGETRAAFARKRRAYEKPHGAKRQKWIPKYKV
eukprot:gene16336-11674_t